MGNNNVKDYPTYLDYPKPRKPITNADRIRAMIDEELAELFAENSCPPGNICPPGSYTHADDNIKCPACWLDWLKKDTDHE